uniref:Putative secreted protein n=1 Tax=Ixodes ricinus TaxID=34613 RepID=A0A6B0U5I5_IXORI
MLVKVALAGPQWHVLALLSRSMAATGCLACNCAQDTKYTSWRHVPSTIASLQKMVTKKKKKIHPHNFYVSPWVGSVCP